MEEYKRVAASLKEGQSLVKQALFYNANSSAKTLDAFAQTFTPERNRVSALTTWYKVGLGFGIGAAIVGAGLLIGGASLQAVNGMQISATGCSVDGLDFGCVRQTDLGARIGLFTVGGALLLAGVLDAGLIRYWIGRQKTYSPVAPPSPDLQPPPVPAPPSSSEAAPAAVSAN